MSKQGEREYAVRASQADLHVKPFNCPRVFREFATALELFQQRIPSGSILDLGCGPGWTSRFLARAGYDVVGVDIAERMIEIARERSATENVAVEFHVADMEELDLSRRRLRWRPLLRLPAPLPQLSGSAPPHLRAPAAGWLRGPLRNDLAAPVLAARKVRGTDIRNHGAGFFAAAVAPIAAAGGL